MTAENCDELAGQPDIDGFLVGGASLKVGPRGADARWWLVNNKPLGGVSVERERNVGVCTEWMGTFKQV